MAYFIQTGRYSLHCFFLLLEFNRVLNSGIIIIFVATYSHVSVSSSQIKTTGKQTSYLFFSVRSASSDSRYSGEQETHWDKTNKRLPSLKMVIFFVFSQCDSCSLALRVFFFVVVPREWRAAKGLLRLWTHTKRRRWFSRATESGTIVERLLPSQKQNSNS